MNLSCMKIIICKFIDRKELEKAFKNDFLNSQKTIEREWSGKISPNSTPSWKLSENRKKTSYNLWMGSYQNFCVFKEF